MDPHPMYRHADASPLRRAIRRSAGWKPFAWLYARTLHLIDRAVFRLTRGRATFTGGVTIRAVLPTLALALSLALAAGGEAAEPKTGQSPDCRRFCMAVEPRQGLEGSVFRITGRGWRPRRLVRVNYGVYCRPDEACIAIAYVARLRTGPRGGFTFRVRAGEARPGDRERRITSGSGFSFSQWLGEPDESRLVQRVPRYRVIVP
jgi:hypothetical protein